MTSVDGQARPEIDVSIVIPCRNEEHTIGGLLDSLAAQTFPSDRLEIVIADGMSTDGTRQQIARAGNGAPRRAVHVIDNPERTVPSGLNRAIAASRGRIIVRIDAHSIPAPDYVQRCVDALLAGKGDSVGGVIDVQPTGHAPIARAIARAACHPFGAGDAAYRIGGREGAVDTVPFGAFLRDTLQRVGPFDEGLPVNQDYEMNARIRAGGGIVWLDPQIRCVYFARPTLRALARQYWRYGLWKRRMLSRHPGSLRWRQVVPPSFVAMAVILGAASPGIPWARRAFTAVTASYALVTGAVAITIARTRRDPLMAPMSALAFATMHISWGAGFLSGLLRRVPPPGTVPIRERSVNEVLAASSEGKKPS